MKLTLKKCFVSTHLLIYIHSYFPVKEISRKYIPYTCFLPALFRKFRIDFYILFKELHSTCFTNSPERISGSGITKKAYIFPRFHFPSYHLLNSIQNKPLGLFCICSRQKITMQKLCI